MPGLECSHVGCSPHGPPLHVDESCLTTSVSRRVSATCANRFPSVGRPLRRSGCVPSRGATAEPHVLSGGSCPHASCRRFSSGRRGCGLCQARSPSSFRNAQGPELVWVAGPAPWPPFPICQLLAHQEGLPDKPPASSGCAGGRGSPAHGKGPLPFGGVWPVQGEEGGKGCLEEPGALPEPFPPGPPDPPPPVAPGPAVSQLPGGGQSPRGVSRVGCRGATGQ